MERDVAISWQLRGLRDDYGSYMWQLRDLRGCYEGRGTWEPSSKRHVWPRNSHVDPVIAA